MTSVFRLLERWDSLPGAIQTIGIALLAIFIPLAIATLQDIYLHKRRGGNTDFVNLDLNVVLDKVFGIKRLLFYAALIFIPTLFWGISPGEFRLLEAVVSLVGITLLAISFFDIYHWIKGNVSEFRFSYLRNLNSNADLEIVWRSVWETKNNSHEKQFFEIFSTKIDKFIENQDKNFDTLFRLLNIFGNFWGNI